MRPDREPSTEARDIDRDWHMDDRPPIDSIWDAIGLAIFICIGLGILLLAVWLACLVVVEVLYEILGASSVAPEAGKP